ncbi:hypothetical protein BKI52_19695 [marine bacterium AO1-C]|nr:hypothetical protein BKI52_19695 [marine bacterium AO1-C]
MFLTPYYIYLMKALQYKVYTSSKMGFSVTSTLIYGEEEAVLIDSQMIPHEATKVVKMIQETGKKLSHILITHAHLDHFGGTEVLLAAFPEAKVWAEPGVVELIANTGEQQIKDLGKMYPANFLPQQAIVPQAFDGDSLDLEGHTIEIITNLQGDFAPHSAFYIGSLQMLVVGDVVYPGVHPWTSDTNNAQREHWIASLEKLATYNAQILITGHKEPTCPDSPQYIAEMIAYLRDFNAANLTINSGQALMDKMISLYPGLKQQGLLKIGAFVNKKEKVNLTEALQME